MIITLAQAKTLLGITGTAKDTLMTALIVEAESKYLEVRNRPFTQITGDLTTDDKTVSNIALYDANSVYNAILVDRMDYLFNDTNSIDNYVTDIDSDTLELDTASTTTATDVIFTVYPKGSKMVAAKLISYLSQKSSMNGLQSESVGSYSWSKGSDGNPAGIPDDLFKSIDRYLKV